MDSNDPIRQHPPATPGVPATHPRQTQPLVTAIFLIGVGIFLLLAQWLQATWINLLILPTLGLAFIAWGVLTHRPGLEVPGGILLGLGLGLLAVGNSLLPESVMPTPAVLMFGLALGFVLVLGLWPLAGGRPATWPIFPALALAGVGFLLMAGDRGFAALAMIGQLWPIALIMAGVAIALGALRRSRP